MCTHTYINISPHTCMYSYTPTFTRTMLGWSSCDSNVASRWKLVMISGVRSTQKIIFTATGSLFLYRPLNTRDVL